MLSRKEKEEQTKKPPLLGQGQWPSKGGIWIQIEQRENAEREEGQWYSEPQSPQWEFRISYVITVLP